MKQLLLFTTLIVLSVVVNAQGICRLSVHTGNKGVAAFTELGIVPVHGFLEKDGVFTGEFERSDLSKLAASQLDYEVIIADVKEYYRNRSGDTKDPVFNSCFRQVENYPLPTGYAQGSMGGYYTLDEAYAALDLMHNMYPNLITVKTQIGSSIEDRPIYSLVISDNPGSSEGEPQVLYTALHHSSEPCSLQQLIFFMFHILEGYGTDPEITYLINNTELYFVPAVNPDGYSYNEQENPDGGGDWRKNRRIVTPFIGNSGIGVDLNRNYGYAYAYDNIGSQPTVLSPWYRGSAAFSEPESSAMRSFLMSHQVKIQVNWHAYGNMLIYPWSYINQSTPDSLLFLAICDKMTEDNHYRYGNVGETYGYQSNGDADDYSYGETTEKPKTLSMTAEIGTNDDLFWPAPDKIDNLCRGAVRQNLNMAHFAHDFYLFDDVSSDIIGSSQGELPFTIECVGLDTPSNFTINYVPLSGNISFQATNLPFANMSLLEKREGSIPYTISAAYGDEVAFVVEGNNGLYTFRDTIYKYYGPATMLFYDDCETMNHWEGDDWDVTNSVYFSGNGSITESPEGNYSLFQTSEIETVETIDLYNMGYAFLTFKTRYAIENTHDYCQISVSNDNGNNWQPLCTKHARVGSDDQDEGQPVYTGIKTAWFTDKASLNDYLGQQIKIRIRFVADQSNNNDGIYFDEFKVIGCDTSLLAIHTMASGELTMYPNPAGETCCFETSDTGHYTVHDLSGRLVGEGFYSAGRNCIATAEWKPGIYVIQFTGAKNYCEKILRM